MYPQIGELVAISNSTGTPISAPRHVHQKRPEGIPAGLALLFQRAPGRHEKTHDLCVEREGVFRESRRGHQASKAAGFQVCTNTPSTKRRTCARSKSCSSTSASSIVDGHQIAPGVRLLRRRRPRIFLTATTSTRSSRTSSALARKYPVHQTPMYVIPEGRARAACTAGQPDLQREGWQGPCYLSRRALQDFEGLMNETPWESYAQATIPAASIGMMHWRV